VVAIYLSDEWFGQVGARQFSPSSTPSEVPPALGQTEEDLVLQHVVSDGPGGEIRYHVRVGGGAVTLIRGQAANPDVTFAEDYATAAAIASGEMTAPAALLAGRIRVGGDVAALMAHVGAFTANDPVPADVRAATTF
jgi:putative sterol carrier protein